MTSAAQSVWMEHEGAVVTITLNRPDALNAFDREMAERFDAALRTAERDERVRAIVVTGAGRAFSAGQDLRELARETREREPDAVGEQMRERFNPIVLRLRAIEKPVLCAINGVTTGAGLGFALASDLRFAADTATFTLSPLSIAFIPGVGSTALLPAIIGLARATELTFTGERITAERALAIGLVHRVVPADRLPAETQAMAAHLATLPTKTIGLTKRAFNRAVYPDLEAQLAYEASLQEVAAATADHREGLAAILEKRKPVFTGR